jgi:FKBP-type peptidyl-prolyl cis-trans isomerase FklB
MKLKAIAPLILATLIIQGRADDKPALKDNADKAGYSIGLQIGGKLKAQLQGANINIDALIAGLKDAYSGKDPQLTPEQQQEALTNLQQSVAADRVQAGEKAKKQGEEFLAANKSQKGVKTLPDGLQYKVLTEGKGEQPKPDSKVTVNYRGTLVDGTEFDSSYKRGEPATFGVDQVIKGWSEALPLMKVGSKWQIFIPAELAYGEHGQATIPPNSVLIFEVELLGVKN